MYIFVPKIKEVFMPHDQYIGSPPTRVRGRFQCVLRGVDGRIKYEGPWQDNLITDYGTSRLRYSDWFSYLNVGSGTTAPAITDTAIESFLGSTIGNMIDGSGTNTQSPDYIRKTVKEHVFSSGNATGTITELGYSGRTDGLEITTHALLAVPIVKGGQDELTITYQIFLYPPIGDVIGVVNIGGEDFNYVCRASNLDNGPASTYANHPSMQLITPNYRNKWMNGTIGTITTAPSGDQQSPAGASISYGGSLGGYYCDLNTSHGVDNGNGTIIKCLWARLGWSTSVLDASSVAPGIQVEISRVADGPGGLAGTGILKEDTHVVGFTQRLYSDRYIP